MNERPGSLSRLLSQRVLSPVGAQTGAQRGKPRRRWVTAQARAGAVRSEQMRAGQIRTQQARG